MMAEARRDLAAGGTIADRGVMLDLCFGMPGVTRRMDSGKVQSDADKDLLKLSKVILESPELKELFRQDGKIREWLRDPRQGMGFGRGAGRGGMYLIPLENFPEVDRRLSEYIERERPALLESVRDRLPERIETSKAALRSEARDVRYPTVDEFMAGLYAKVLYISFGVPGNLPAAIQVREKARLDELFREQAEEFRAALTEGFAELVNHTVDRLDGGKRAKRFSNESWEEKWGGFFEAFGPRSRMLGGDADLERLVETARKLVSGVDPQELKDSGRLRRQVLVGMRAVKAEVDKLLEDGPVRVIRE